VLLQQLTAVGYMSCCLQRWLQPPWQNRHLNSISQHLQHQIKHTAAMGLGAAAAAGGGLGLLLGTACCGLNSWCW
jgi:hypothetical protein